MVQTVPGDFMPLIVPRNLIGRDSLNPLADVSHGEGLLLSKQPRVQIERAFCAVMVQHFQQLEILHNTIIIAQGKHAAFPFRKQNFVKPFQTKHPLSNY
jgi:hypothetical protein